MAITSLYSVEVGGLQNITLKEQLEFEKKLQKHRKQYEERPLDPNSVTIPIVQTGFKNNGVIIHGKVVARTELPLNF